MEKPKTVKLTINDKAIEAPAGSTVFEAAAANGIFIPHYCYHPDLSIAGVCRMCMCEIEKNPRLQISCNTPVAEGMVVKTNTEKVKQSVKTTLELHLINHPIDCPICDKAGECKLQDFYRDYGLYQSRMEYEKVHKPKVQDIGTIVLDAERCILCSRCTRFTAEVTKTHELGIFNRGDRAVLSTYDNGPLRNDYTGNLADICPVGALTAKDFRFQCRVWFLEKTSTVCGLCAHGCNTVVSVNPTGNKLYRVEPRRNPEVNKSWICDTGRWDFHFVYKDNRLKVPLLHSDGQLKEITWHEAFGRLNEEIAADPKAVLAAISTSATNEEILDTVGQLKELGVTNFTWLVDEKVVDDRKPFDGVLKHRDLTANALGFQTVMQLLKVKWLKQAKATELLKKGGIKRVLLLGIENEAAPGVATLLADLPKGVKVAAHATNFVPAFERCELVLPNTSSYEKSGTFINAEGRLQKLNGSIPWQYTSRDLHALSFGLVQGGDRAKAPATRAQEIFESTVVEKILLGEDPKWRRFNPLGIPVSEKVVHAASH